MPFIHTDSGIMSLLLSFENLVQRFWYLQSHLMKIDRESEPKSTSKKQRTKSAIIWNYTVNINMIFPAFSNF